MFAARARAYGTHLAFCNLVGGQDELVFDGHSFVVDPSGEILARAAQFEEELLLCDIPSPGSGRLAEPLADLAEVYGALVLGLRDYVRKNGFRHVGVALSGGIDSALVALLAADAIGPENVSCVIMPSPHSSDETQADARTIAANLGAEAIEIPIEAAMAAYREALPERSHSTPVWASRCERTRMGGRCPAIRLGPPSPTLPPRTSRRGSAAT